MPLRVVILSLGLLLRLLFRVTTLMSLGLLLGLLFRFLEGTPEIGKRVANVNKCRFLLFSDRKNDIYLLAYIIYISMKPLIFSDFTLWYPEIAFQRVCVRRVWEAAACIV